MKGAPIKVATVFGLMGVLLVIVGIVRGAVPARPASIVMALLIGGGVWFLVSWAVANAVYDVASEIEDD
jgi:hypothetical protein